MNRFHMTQALTRKSLVDPEIESLLQCVTTARNFLPEHGVASVDQRATIAIRVVAEEQYAYAGELLKEFMPSWVQ